MDKFSKILVSAAAASVLASGAMASGLVFYYTQDTNVTADVQPEDANATAAGLRNDYNLTWIQANRPQRMNGVILVDDLLKGVPGLVVNAYNTTSWPGAGLFQQSIIAGVAQNWQRNHRVLAYYSDSELPKDATLTFKVNCGMLQKVGAQDVYLYALDTDANGTSAWIRVGHLTDFDQKIENGITGYTKLKFAVDSNYEVANDSDAGVTNGGGVDHNFTIFNGAKEVTDDQQGNIPAGTLLVFATDRNRTTNILSDRGIDYSNNDTNLSSLFIAPRKGDECGCVCATTLELIDAKDKTGSDLSAPKSNVQPVTLVNYTSGLRAVVNTPGVGIANPRPSDSWIDLRATSKRKRFVPSGQEPTGIIDNDTTPLTSAFDIWLDQTNAQFGVNLNTRQDIFKINVNRAIDCAVKRVDLSSNIAGGGTPQQLIKNTETGAYERESNFNALNILNSRVTFTVNGTDVICPGMWRVSLTIDPSAAGVPAKKVLNVANADDWRMTAMEFIVPYLNTDPNYGTYIVITNQGDETANVFFDAFGDGGKNAGTPSSAYYTNVPLGDIPRRSTRIYFPKDMNAALKARFPAWNANRYMAHFYVATSTTNIQLIEDSIEAAAFQKDGNNGKRSIPVLTRGRVWNGGQITGHTFHE